MTPHRSALGSPSKASELDFTILKKLKIGRTNGRTGGRASGRAGGRTDGRTVGRADRRTDGPSRHIGHEDRRSGRPRRADGRTAQTDSGQMSIVGQTACRSTRDEHVGKMACRTDGTEQFHAR